MLLDDHAAHMALATRMSLLALQSTLGIKLNGSTWRAVTANAFSYEASVGFCHEFLHAVDALCERSTRLLARVPHRMTIPNRRARKWRQPALACRM